VGITPQQFEQMQNRVSGGLRAATPVFDTSLRVPTNHQVILGIDRPAPFLDLVLAVRYVRCS